MEILLIIAGLISGVTGAIIVQKAVLKNKTQKVLKDAEAKAENIKKERILQAKERFLKLKEEHESKIKERDRRIQSSEDRVKAKENKLENKLSDLGRKERQLEKTSADYDAKYKGLEIRMKELDKTQEKRVSELSKISGMSADDAKNLLMEALKDEARTAAMAEIKEITEEAKLNGNK